MILLSNFIYIFPIRTSTLLQYFILAKFNTFWRSWKPISESNTLNTTWELCTIYTDNKKMQYGLYNVPMEALDRVLAKRAVGLSKVQLD